MNATLIFKDLERDYLFLFVEEIKLWITINFDSERLHIYDRRTEIINYLKYYYTWTQIPVTLNGTSDKSILEAIPIEIFL